MSAFSSFTDFLNDQIVRPIPPKHITSIENTQKHYVPFLKAELKPMNLQKDNSNKKNLDQELETIIKEIESTINSNNELFDVIEKNNKAIKLNEIENFKLQSQIDLNTKNSEALRKANSEFLDKVAVNNETIEKLEVQKIEIVKKIEVQKKIAQDPLFHFREDVKEASKLKGIDVSLILNQFEQLYKSIKNACTNVSLDKLPNGKYDYMIESIKVSQQGTDVKNKISTFRSLFMMLNSLF